MSTILDRNEVQEIYGLLSALAKEQTAIKKRLDSIENKLDSVIDELKIKAKRLDDLEGG